MTHVQTDFFDTWHPSRQQLQQMQDAIPAFEKVPVSRAALILSCSTQHVYNLILDGTLLATNIARNLDTRPDYRVFTSSIRSFLLSRCEGAKS